MKSTITAEEKNKIMEEYYKAGGINMESYADWLMEKTSNLISFKKDAEIRELIKSRDGWKEARLRLDGIYNFKIKELKSKLEESEKAKDWIINQGVKQVKRLNKQLRNSIPKSRVEELIKHLSPPHSFCPICGWYLTISDHYCGKCRERIAVSLEFSEEAIKKISKILLGGK